MLLNNNASLLKELLLKADTLGCIVSNNRFPVLLRPLAERRKVTSVEFCPLLVDAMITTHTQGFRIIFNSGDSDASELRIKYENENENQIMPSRLRFSLAHEIAHTFFYNLSDEPPQLLKSFRAGGKKTALEVLERNCNRIAAHLLLPTPLLKAKISNMKPINPESLINLASSAGVSIETLVRRIGDAGALLESPYFCGCIVLVKQTGANLTISAIAKPARINIARELRMMRPGENWQLKTQQGIDVGLDDSTPIKRLPLTVETPQSSVVKPYVMAVKQLNGFGSAKSFLLSFEQASI